MNISGRRMTGLVVMVLVVVGVGCLAYFLKHQARSSQTAVEPLAEVPTMGFEVYFSRESLSGDCTLVEPVSRTAPESADIASAAIEALLAGPTPQELQDGYLTSINQDVRLLDIEMSGSRLTATFSSRLQEGVAGSCRVSAIRSQIEQTLKQFATVSEAVIRIEGVPEGEELQP